MSNEQAADATDHAGVVPSIRKRPRRTHARRSCQMCQQRKARCELPDLTVPSGPDPLDDHLACHRCKTLQISCIVDDSNKKRGRKLAEASNAPSAHRSGSGRPTLSRSNTSGVLSAMTDRIRIERGKSSSDTAEGLTKRLAFQNDSGRGGQPSRPRLISRTPSLSGSEPGSPTALEAEVRHAKAVRSISGLPAPPLDIDGWEKYSIRSRPLTLLTELIPRQRGFASRTSRLVSDQYTVEADIKDVVDDEKSLLLAEWCDENLVFWLPHITSARMIRQASLKNQQTVSSQLLEAALYLVALQHINDPKDDILRFTVARLVLRDLGRVMLSSPRETKAMEALELLAIFPVDVSVLPGPSKNRIRTDGLMDAAERLGRSLRIDRIAMSCDASLPFSEKTDCPLGVMETTRRAVQWVNVRAWHTCFTLGDDELLESISSDFADEAWIRSLPLQCALMERYSNDTGSCYFIQGDPAAWWARRKVGIVGVTIRGLLFQKALMVIHSLKSVSDNGLDDERIQVVDGILRKWRVDFEALEAERARELPDNIPTASMISDWLAVEFANLDLTIHGMSCLKALGLKLEPSLRAAAVKQLMREKQLSPATFRFLAVHGERRLDAAEAVLNAVTKLTQRDGLDLRTPELSHGTTASSTTSGSPPLENFANIRSRLPVPMLNVIGYAFEAALTAVEMHAKVIKAWKKPPRRSESWQNAFQGVINGLEAADPQGSVESGSIAATGAYIIKGMLEVLTTWTVFSKRYASQIAADPQFLHKKGGEAPNQGDLNFRLNMLSFAQTKAACVSDPDAVPDASAHVLSRAYAPSLTASLFEAGRESGAVPEPWPRNDNLRDEVMIMDPLGGFASNLAAAPMGDTANDLLATQSWFDPGAPMQDSGLFWSAYEQMARPSTYVEPVPAPPDYNSIEAILNEVLGSNEWTGVLDDMLAKT
ncbi:hypothetical protein ACQY0O_000427 [Thecaphora frezii]